MRYLIAFIAPPLAVLLCGKPFQAILNCFLTLALWVPGVIHACLVINSYHADVRTGRIVREMRRQGPGSAVVPEARPAPPARSARPRVVEPTLEPVVDTPERIQGLLAQLRDGAEAEKIFARDGLSRIFEARGMLAEAIELLEGNARAGVRDSFALTRLARLYRSAGRIDEADAAMAETTRATLAPQPTESETAPDQRGRPDGLPRRVIWIGLATLGVLAVFVMMCALVAALDGRRGSVAAVPTATTVAKEALASAPNATPAAPTVAPTQVPTRTTPPKPTAPPTPEPTAVPVPEPVVVVVVNGGTGGVNVRSAPDGERLRLVRDGVELTMLGEEQRASEKLWKKVRTSDGAEGWIADGFIVEKRLVPERTEYLRYGKALMRIAARSDAIQKKLYEDMQRADQLGIVGLRNAATVSYNDQASLIPEVTSLATDSRGIPLKSGLYRTLIERGVVAQRVVELTRSAGRPDTSSFTAAQAAERSELIRFAAGMTVAGMELKVDQDALR
ncbi:MAG: YqaE/Pmp3 family membrane protein [Chloroflexota bacterium]